MSTRRGVEGDAAHRRTATADAVAGESDRAGGRRDGDDPASLGVAAELVDVGLCDGLLEVRMHGGLPEVCVRP
jgi:hypothetical protein